MGDQALLCNRCILRMKTSFGLFCVLVVLYSTAILPTSSESPPGSWGIWQSWGVWADYPPRTRTYLVETADDSSDSSSAGWGSAERRGLWGHHTEYNDDN